MISKPKVLWGTLGGITVLSHSMHASAGPVQPAVPIVRAEILYIAGPQKRVNELVNAGTKIARLNRLS